MSSSAAESTELNPYFPINIGRYADGSPAEFSFTQAPNFGVNVIGTSGSGKTYCISQLCREYYLRGITPFILDTQGDFLEGPNALPKEWVYHVPFRYGKNTQTINPLRVEPGTDGAGYLAMAEVIEVIRVMKPSLGDLQKGDLQRLVLGLLERFGIDPERSPDHVERVPDWIDLSEYLQDVIAVASQKELPDKGVVDLVGKYRVEHKKAAAELEKARAKLETAMQKQDADAQEEAESEVEAARETCREIRAGCYEDLSELADSESDRLFDTSGERWNVKRLEGIKQIVENMKTSGLFGRDELRVSLNRINVFDLSRLRAEHIPVMMYLVLSRVYGLLRGQYREINPKVPWLMAVVDEAKYAAPFAASYTSPINLLATEGRKFGGGLVCGVQHFGQINEEIRSSLGTKILLPIEESRWDEAAKIIQVPRHRISSMRSKRDGLVRTGQTETELVRMFADQSAES